jgi:HK97 family phage prohead protease
VDYLVAPFELLETKAGKDGPEFSGYVSTFGNIDAGADVVLPGAFDRTLKERTFRPLLWGHQQSTPPIGTEKSLVPDSKGLLGTWELIDTQLGQDVYKALKRGALRSMSMGYVAVDAEFDSDVRKLIDVELLESSLVNIPMNDAAVITAVKSRQSIIGPAPEVNDSSTESQPQLKFAEHVDRVTADIAGLLARAEDIAALRAGDGRNLSAEKFSQLKGLRAGLDELLRLENPTNDAAVGDALRLRLAIARRKFARELAESTN